MTSCDDLLEYQAGKRDSNCLPETDTLLARKVGELAYCVYGSRSFVEENPKSRTDERYVSCDWLGFAPDDLWYPSQMQWMENHRIGRPRLRTNTMTTLMNMTIAGKGLSLLPAFMANVQPSLVALTGPLPELTYSEHIIVHRDLRREPAVRKAMDAIAVVYRDMAPLLSGKAQQVITA